MNLILSLSTEARMVIAEIVTLIGILIILFLYTNIKSKNILNANVIKKPNTDGIKIVKKLFIIFSPRYFY